MEGQVKVISLQAYTNLLTALRSGMNVLKESAKQHRAVKDYAHADMCEHQREALDDILTELVTN